MTRHRMFLDALSEGLVYGILLLGFSGVVRSDPVTAGQLITLAAIIWAHRVGRREERAMEQRLAPARVVR